MNIDWMVLLALVAGITDALRDGRLTNEELPVFAQDIGRLLKVLLPDASEARIRAAMLSADKYVEMGDVILDNIVIGLQ